MSAVDPAATLDDWLKRFDLIEDDVQEILLRRHVFRRLQEIVAANPRLHRPSYLYEYLTGTYAASAAIAVRRHARDDDERRGSSLIGLLHAVRRRPELLTRARHVQLYEDVGMPADLAEAEFDRIAEPGAPHLAKPHVLRDLDELHRVADDLERTRRSGLLTSIARRRR
jgi:hypothetical protein